jgi:hypothetical protein
MRKAGKLVFRGRMEAVKRIELNNVFCLSMEVAGLWTYVSLIKEYFEYSLKFQPGFPSCSIASTSAAGGLLHV